MAEEERAKAKAAVKKAKKQKQKAKKQQPTTSAEATLTEEPATETSYERDDSAPAKGHLMPVEGVTDGTSALDTAAQPWNPISISNQKNVVEQLTNELQDLAMGSATAANDQIDTSLTELFCCPLTKVRQQLQIACTSTYCYCN